MHFFQKRLKCVFNHEINERSMNLNIQYLLELSRKLRGEAFLDFKYLSNKDVSRDRVHLNENGKEVIQKRTLKVMITNYI